MQRVEIDKEKIATGAEHSSKGNQMKWEYEGYWYKADAFGYESLAEVVASHLLEYSNIREFVQYEPVQILYGGKWYRGCRSKNFRKGKEELVPLERLARQYTGFGLAQELGRIADTKQRILYTEELVRNITGLDGFGEYLSKMLEIDAFFLNEDRHTNNIALLYDVEQKTYRFCPFYDMGLSLFSDTRESYPLGMSLKKCLGTICAKPFHRDFDQQLDAGNELYGSFLKFQIPASKITAGLEVLAEGYRQEELDRVKEVLRNQARKYGYMFP